MILTWRAWPSSNICFSQYLKWSRTPGPFLSAKGMAGHGKGVSTHSFKRPIIVQWLWGLGVNHSRNTSLRMRSWRNLNSEILGFNGRKLKSKGWKYLLSPFIGTYSVWKTIGQFTTGPAGCLPNQYPFLLSFLLKELCLGNSSGKSMSS